MLFRSWVFVSVRGPSPAVASGGHLFIAVRGPLTITASLVAEHRLQTCRLSNCGSRAQLLRGMWDLPRPGLEPVSPALAGRLSTTAPPGKPWALFKNKKSERDLYSTHGFLVLSGNTEGKEGKSGQISFLTQ